MDCILEGDEYSTGSYSNNCVIYADSICDSNLFQNNQILNGAYGICFIGVSGVVRSHGNKFIGNSVMASYYRGAYFYYHTDLHFTENSVKMAASYPYHYGAMFYYADGDLEITRNTLCAPGYTALYCYQIEGDQTDPVLIANNHISSGDGTNFVYGVYVYGTSYLRFVHNTVIKNSMVNHGYYGFYLYMQHAELYNNIFMDENASASYPLIYLSGTYTQNFCLSNYNTFYAPNNFSLSQWQQSTGLDSNSMELFPGHLSCAHAVPCNDSLDGTGTALSYVTTDLYGQLRNPVNPDIGAVEWSAPHSASFTPMQDTFICSGKSIILETPNTGYKYLWNTQDSTKSIEVSQAGTYFLEFTDYCGGVHYDTVVVTDSTPVAAFHLSQTPHYSIELKNQSMNSKRFRWIVWDGADKTGPVLDTFWVKDTIYSIGPPLTYYFCLTAYNQCDLDETCDIFSPIGIGESILDDVISIQPNPVSEFLTIKFKGQEDDQFNLEVNSIQGQTIFNRYFVNVSGNTTRIFDVSGLKPGIYILRFTSVGTSISMRIIVQ